MIQFLTIFIIAYIVGSVNVSILLFKFLGRRDPRNEHSGNAGATNVFRQAGLFWASVVLVLDLIKSLGVSWLAYENVSLACVSWIGLGLLLGNRFPLFHGFRGGKGVANYLGFTLMLAPMGAGVAVVLYAIILPIVRIPFVASLSMVSLLGVGIYYALGEHPLAAMGMITCTLFIVWCHRENIQKLIDEIFH